MHFSALPISRRALLGGAGATLALTLAGCNTVGLHDQPPLPDERFDYDLAYAARKDGDFDIPAINYKAFDRRYWRQVVDYENREIPGTIVVDPQNKFLYWILSRRKALRYGIGVGKAGFAWSGDAVIRMKQEWPVWRPPKEMIARRPELARYGDDGMEGGPKNPLGARALYLWQGNVDTLYRIHGTNEPSSIGKNVSSGCIRMWHQDVIDLYARVPMNTKVIVLGGDGTTPA
ncbi:ErfK/YbiS/YcfS/YnhG family [Polymorphum gilvum SL003B-26A1]|uniref:ErfK/YbiS/YcfS/YnhG family n=2 Tax=Polymorphum TaxID=991903 RepID=F2IWB0_POLGS|nr:ErfK/YbiS/YcfS/YnhG family [Polymorphum gilvum SL003B-26A1]